MTLFHQSVALLQGKSKRPIVDAVLEHVLSLTEYYGLVGWLASHSGTIHKRKVLF
jgi:hypothetical protein